jgi:hypothetical protein
VGAGGGGMTQEEWKRKNNYWNTHACCFCRFYHFEDDELLDVDRDYCEEHGKSEKDEEHEAFCREMRDDGVEDYYLIKGDSMIDGCERWLTQGFV